MSPIIHKITTGDGTAIAAHLSGPRHATRLPVICLPGLTRTARDFRHLLALADSLQRRIVAIDLRGRGMSDWADHETYAPAIEAGDVLSVMTALDLGPSILVGTSRGAIVSMVMAAMRPTLIAASVLNDLGPVISMRGLLRLRGSLGGRRMPENFTEAAALLRHGLGHQFPGFSDEDWRAYAADSFHDDNGTPVVDFDPGILSGLDAIRSDMPDLDLTAAYLGLIERPSLLLRGEHSDILSEDTYRSAIAMGAQGHVVPGEGHAPMMKGDTLARIARFIREQD